VNRNYRLKQSSEFMRVRRFGKSYAHPLLVLVALIANDEKTSIGVVAGRSVGKAVARNRAKRMLREAVRPLLPKLKPGLKLLLISRRPILEANLEEIQDTLIQLFTKAHLLRDDHGN
jgi:ribonuclease P protein component